MQFGEVGKETVPARRMLEKLGFHYENFVDPFDGGPYLFAKTDEIPLVRDTRRLTLGDPVSSGDAAGLAIVSLLDKDGEFFAVQSAYRVGRDGTLGLPREACEALSGTPGATVGFTPLDGSEPPGGVGAAGRSGREKTIRKTTKKKAATK
jgi:arginine N-succinyltransferase